MYSYWLSNKDFVWIVPHMNERAPAAVRQSDSLQQVIEKPMRVFKKEVVAGSISISQKDGKKYFTMGQFPVPVGEGQNLICVEYPYIKLKFLGDGASVNGKQPTAWINAPCAVSEKNKDFISEIALPFSDLKRWPAQSQEVDFSQPGMPIKVKFEQVLGDWPRLWKLEHVEFHRDQSDSPDRIIFSNYDFMKRLGEPVFVK
jgi:hypothetical protein